MAKWGEGDPRWIVEERPDATNVNNWHWTEKNAGPWSKERLKELLTNLKIDQHGIECKITEVEKVDGEASANNRKGKLIFFFEWDIKLKWEGRLIGGEENVTGEVQIPNLSEENDVSEVDVSTYSNCLSYVLRSMICLVYLNFINIYNNSLLHLQRKERSRQHFFFKLSLNNFFFKYYWM